MSTEIIVILEKIVYNRRVENNLTITREKER
jgi:hypothetical protein